ncbi:MAG: AAA family ATPase [Rhodothermales bacterium]
MKPSRPENEPTAVRPGSTEYEHLLAQLETATQAGAGARLLFTGEADKAAKDALQALADRTAFHVHQVNLETLMADRPAETQANLRETFDTAPQDAILFFYNADRLLALDEKADDDALTPADYLFRRMEAFNGIAILYAPTSEQARRARTAADLFDAEVRFAGTEAA